MSAVALAHLTAARSNKQIIKQTSVAQRYFVRSDGCDLINCFADKPASRRWVRRFDWPNLIHLNGGPAMDEATVTIAPAPNTVIAPAVRASMSRAVRVLARQRAVREVKRELQAQGRRKVSQVPMREIVAMAEDYILAHREIIVEARAKVERWEAEGYFRPRRRSVRNVPELRTLTDREQRECGGNGQ
jgi:hypothetical protein